jgi:hypothetical protein
LEAEVRASVAASLALWDPGLCGMLLDQPTATLLDPLQAISAWATASGWSATWTDSELESRGLLGDFGMAEKRLHSGIHALRNEGREIQLRVWRGQVGVLLPFVEERRRDLLHAFGPWLTLPYQPDRGDAITDASDLELGHLYRMFAGDRRLAPECRALIETLREMRNSLAHFVPVKAEQLHAPELADYGRALARVRPQNGCFTTASNTR